MNIRKQLKTATIISVLCTGFILAPSTALAEKSEHNGKQHANSSHQERSRSRSHNDKYSNRYDRHGKKHHGRYKPYRTSRNDERRHHHNGRRQHSHNYGRYYPYPWYVNTFYLNDGGFSIGYQDEHFGFTIRD